MILTDKEIEQMINCFEKFNKKLVKQTKKHICPRLSSYSKSIKLTHDGFINFCNANYIHKSSNQFYICDKCHLRKLNENKSIDNWIFPSNQNLTFIKLDDY